VQLLLHVSVAHDSNVEASWT